MSVRVNVAEVKADINKMIGNVPQARKAAGIFVVLQAQKKIINQGDGEWPPLKRLPKRPHQLLWDTGTLLRSLAPGGADNIMEENANGITVGTSVAYAAAQNFGLPSRGLPARTFFVESSETEGQIAAIYKQNILKGVANGTSV